MGLQIANILPNIAYELVLKLPCVIYFKGCGKIEEKTANYLIISYQNTEILYFFCWKCPKAIQNRWHRIF